MSSAAVQSAGLRIQLFGRMGVWVDGKPIQPLRTRKGQWLLALLALRQGREVDRNWLAGTLWPESLDTQAYASLRRALTDLRQALGAQAGCIDSPSPSTLRLADAGVCVDTVAFDEAIALGDAASLERAVSMRHGPLLETCPEPWAIHEREAREQAYVCALQKLGDLALADADLAEAEAWLRRAALADPLRESVHRALMETLARRGDLAAVVAVYREVRLRLRDELNVDPDPQTTSLYHSLRAGALAKPGTSSGRASAPRPAGITPCISLPRPLTEFVGRSDDVRDLLKLLSEARLVTLTGPGGIGKTRLAIQVAEEYANAFGDDVFFVDLAPLHSAELLPHTVARSVHASEEEGRGIAEALGESIRYRRLVLVLDNCEHLFAACAELAERLLAAAPGLRILATSRRALGITSEAVWRVSPLSLPAGGAMEELDRSEAVTLFTQRARAARADFAVTARNAAAVEHICRRLDGMPLALELAAVRLKVLTAEQIASRLDRMFELLSAGSTTAIPRHRTLRAALDWSFESLGEPERTLARRLSVFPGRFSLEAAEGVCAAALGKDERRVDQVAHVAPFLDLVSELVEQSFLSVEEHDGEARYRMLATTHEYACEQLRAAGEEELLQLRHAEHFLAFAERAAPFLDSPSAPEWLDHIEEAIDDIRAALAYWSDRSDPEAREAGLRTVNALWGYWMTRLPAGPGGETGFSRMFSEPAGWLEKLLSGYTPRGAVAAVSLTNLAELRLRLSDPSEARDMVMQSLAIYDEIGDTEGAAPALRTLAAAERSGGNASAARGLYEQSLRLYRDAGDARGAAVCLSGLGALARSAGDCTMAIKLYRESLQFARSAARPLLIASVLTDLGNASYGAGDYEAAIRAHAESLEIDETLQHTVGVAWSLANLAEAELAMERLDASEAHCTRALRLFLGMKHRRGTADALTGFAQILDRRGDTDGAARFKAAAQALTHLSGHATCDSEQAPLWSVSGNDAWDVTTELVESLETRGE